MPSLQAAIYFLLVWTFVSIPLAMLVGAMIKFGADGKLLLEQSDRRLRTLSLEMRSVTAAMEKRAAQFGRSS
jgi:hypothetical protein